MLEFVVGVIVGVMVVLAVVAARHAHGRRGKGSPPEPTAPATLDLRRSADPARRAAALEVWWELEPIMTIERLDQRGLPPTAPVPGAVGQLIARLLDDTRVHDLLGEGRMAVVRVPPHLRGHDWVHTVEGRRVALMRDTGTGRFSGLPTVVGGAGTGAAIGGAPVLAGAVAAAWAQHQLESTMAAVRAGLERIELRLDDTDHGVIAAAQAVVGRLTGPPSGWTDLEIAELAAHTAALDRVHATARRRAERRFDALMDGDEFPRLDGSEVRDTQRDLVLLVDATLARGQLELARAVTMLDPVSGDVRAGLDALARLEDTLRHDLDELAGRLGEAVERAEPGWHKITTRRRVQHAKSELGATIGGLEQLLDDLNAERDIELVVGRTDGELEVRAPTDL